MILEISGGGGAFNSNRPILRTYFPGLVVGGTTVNEFLEWMFFTAPTMAISQSPNQSIYEVGTTGNISWTLTTTNDGGALLDNGQFRVTSPVDSLLSSYSAAVIHNSPTLNFTPIQNDVGRYNEHQYVFRGQQDWDKDGDTGTAFSPTKTIYGVYPIISGMSNTDFTLGGNPYGTMGKIVEREGNKTVTLNGSGFIYYFIPKTWGDWNLSQIIDHNGFNVTASFTAFDITVTSMGLTNNWTNVEYRGYKLNNTTVTSGFDYQFIR